MNVFDDEPEAGAIVSVPVAEGRERARAVFHDHDDDWQISCGTIDPDDVDSWVTLHLHHVLERDPTVRVVGDLPVGWAAYRDHIGQPWEREALTDPDSSEGDQTTP